MSERQKPSLKERVGKIMFKLFTDLPDKVIDYVVYEDLHGGGIRGERKKKALDFVENLEKHQSQEVKKP